MRRGATHDLEVTRLLERAKRHDEIAVDRSKQRAQRFGTLPVVRRTGGLNDTVDDESTGFVFDQFSVPALASALQRAVQHYRDENGWQMLMRRAMAKNFSWQHSALKYLAVYLKALEVAERTGRGTD